MFDDAYLKLRNWVSRLSEVWHCVNRGRGRIHVLLGYQEHTRCSVCT
jgi:hypothetical protein